MATDFYTELAATLRGIADDIAGLAGRGLPGNLYVSLGIQTDHQDDDTEIVAAIDTVGQALLGQPGTTERMSSGSYQHAIDGERGGGWRAGGLNLRVYGAVTPPEKRALQAEIETLRAERDRLAAQVERPEAQR